MSVAITLFVIIFALIKLNNRPGGLGALFKSTTGNTASKNVGIPPADMKNPEPVLGMGQKAFKLDNTVPLTRSSVAQSVDEGYKKPIQDRKEYVTTHKEPLNLPISMHREPPVNRLMDDREHDWLAGQLRDERTAKRRMSDMFDLKMDHSRNCDAEMLRQFHSSNCDAEGVDTAKA
ncbi:MAG: hypothetical protein IK123_03110 [Lachnospiraceae bacterium]|nr:hypothetical protein [Lachnospiraceae bacterium]